MNKYLPILIILGILFAACVPTATTDQSTISSPASSKINVTNPTTLVQSTSKDSPQVSSAGIPTYSNLSPSQVSSDNSTSGIWVVGEGTIQLKPDLTILRIGVESKARSVREANKNATKAMDSINKIVKSFEVKEDKIQTVSYNISPEYEWQQPRGGGSSKRVLIGYVVSNTVVVQITKIDQVGELIDSVTDAGGDTTRIDNIQFTVQDKTLYSNQLREQAIQNAISKAEQLATLSGVNLGLPFYITEISGTSPTVKSGVLEAAPRMAMGANVSTPISSGELELSMKIQVGFSIN
tara:strand:+ start:2793 stop:3677 length:885 start_codon:yes stop_codon:yes gene_type:complete